MLYRNFVPTIGVAYNIAKSSALLQFLGGKIFQAKRLRKIVSGRLLNDPERSFVTP
jgi:hypothetical protein